MRVTNEILTSNFLQGLNNLQAQMEQDLQQLSTGKAINQPSDNPLGAAQVMNFTSVLNQAKIFQGNIQDGTAWLQSAQTAVTEAGALVQSAQQAAVQGANGDMPQSALDSLAQQVNAQIGQLIQQGNTAYGNRYVFGGYQTQSPPFQQMDLAVSATTTAYNAATGNATVSGTVTGTDTHFGANTYLYVINQYGDTVLQTPATVIGPTALSFTATLPPGRYTLQVADQQDGTLATYFVVIPNVGQSAATPSQVAGVSYRGDAGALMRQIAPGTDVPVNVPGNRLFTNQEVDVSTPFNGANTPLGIAGTFQINGQNIAVTSGTTLNDLVQQINAAGAGVTAYLTPTDTGAYRLTVQANNLGGPLSVGGTQVIPPPIQYAEVSGNPAYQLGLVTDNTTGPYTVPTAANNSLPPLRNVFQDLITMRSHLQAGDIKDLSNQDLPNLAADANQLTTGAAAVGAGIDRLQSSQSGLTAFQNSVTTLLANVQDTNMPKVITQFSNLQAAFQASLEAGAKIIQPTLFQFLS